MLYTYSVIARKMYYMNLNHYVISVIHSKTCGVICSGICMTSFIQTLFHYF